MLRAEGDRQPILQVEEADQHRQVASLPRRSAGAPRRSRRPARASRRPASASRSRRARPARAACRAAARARRPAGRTAARSRHAGTRRGWACRGRRRSVDLEGAHLHQLDQARLQAAAADVGLDIHHRCYGRRSDRGGIQSLRHVDLLLAVPHCRGALVGRMVRRWSIQQHQIGADRPYHDARASTAGVGCRDDRGRAAARGSERAAAEPTDL